MWPCGHEAVQTKNDRQGRQFYYHNKGGSLIGGSSHDRPTDVGLTNLNEGNIKMVKEGHQFYYQTKNGSPIGRS
jgi:hypothetical protein